MIESPISIWNLPLEEQTRDARSPQSLIRVIESYFGKRPIQVLEIGVFQGGFAKRIHQSSLEVSSYDGVDPYSGDKEDPYSNSENYWKNETGAEKVYHETFTALKSLGFSVHRKSSLVYFSSELRGGKTFDLIHVDGDHRYPHALLDMTVCFAALADEGILVIDDYANADTPGVTWAFDAFHRENKADIKRMGHVSNWFQLGEKPAPMSQASIYLEPLPQAERKSQSTVSEILQDMHENIAKSPPWTAKLLDLSPRKVLRCMLGKQ